MGRKRKKTNYPHEWDVVEGTQDLEGISPSPHSQEPAPLSETYRLKKTTKDTHSSVICKLTRICHVPEIIEEIKRICVIMKQVQLEGWHLVNLHLLHCLHEGEELPELSQMFFYRCCAASLGNIESRDRCKQEPKYLSFHQTCLRYWTGRERTVTYAAESFINGCDMINEMAKLMEINAGNMIALQFRRRLYQYIRFRYAPVGVVQLKNRDTKRLVDSCFRVKTVPVVDEDGNSTDMTEKSWTKWDETDDPVEKELREWLQIVPWQWQIRANATHFVRKLYDMLSWMEAFVKNNPTTKGTRLYSLLPVSTTYQAAYVKINGTTLHEIFNHTPDQPKMEEFLEEKLNIVRIRKKTSDLQRPFTKKTFQSHRSEILRTVFDVEQFETENRKFVNEIKTNGYGASVTLIRPLTTTSVTVVTSKKKRKKNDGATETKVKRTVKTPEEIADADCFAKELLKLGPEYSPDVLIGIDPGMRSLVTSVTVGRLRRRKQRKKRVKRQSCRIRPQRKPKVMTISVREYRHLSRMDDFRFWNENLKKREPWYASIVRSMPSFKTASYDTYFKRLQFFWTHLRFLLAFSAEQAFLRWRFTQDRAKMAALDTLAKRLVPIPSKQVCIGYGDWSRRDGIKGYATGPVKGVVEALKKRATVVPIDEYRTSVTCSSCHKRLKQARLFVQMKKKEGEQDIRLKMRPSRKEVKEIAEVRKFRNPKLASKKVVLKCTRNVLRCTNSRCKANFWNRDVNAARNMLELLRSGLKGKLGTRKLRAFRRGQIRK